MARRPRRKESIPLSNLTGRQNPDYGASLPQPNDSQSSAPTTLAEPTSAPVPRPPQPTPRANIASLLQPNDSQSSAPTTLAEPTSAPVPHPPQPTPRANNASASPPSASSNVSRQSHTSNPQTHTSDRSWIRSHPWSSTLTLALTVPLVVITIKDSRDQANFGQQELDLLRGILDSLQGTAPAGENRVTRPDHLVARSESPQCPSILLYLLERCLGSRADWENDETLFPRLIILAELMILPLILIIGERKFRQWLSYRHLAPVARFLGIEEEKPKPDTIGWPPESPSAIFVGTEKQGGVCDFVRIDVANLSSGDRVLWDIARYFGIWTLYETWCRLHDLRLVKVRTMIALHHPRAVL
ncbi:MAG: hypothetical protein Q9163_005994 [Psora crenata]